MKKELFQNTVLEMIPHVAPSLMSVFFVQSSKNGAGIPTDCYRQLKIIIGGQRSKPSPRSMRISSSAGNTGPIWPRPLAFRCVVSYTYPGFLRDGGRFYRGKATFS